MQCQISIEFSNDCQTFRGGHNPNDDNDLQRHLDYSVLGLKWLFFNVTTVDDASL